MGNCPFVDFKSGWRISNPAGGSQIRLADFKSGWRKSNPAGGFQIRLGDFKSGWGISNPAGGFRNQKCSKICKNPPEYIPKPHKLQKCKLKSPKSNSYGFKP
jgi:hypothetical protein